MQHCSYFGCPLSTLNTVKSDLSHYLIMIQGAAQYATLQKSNYVNKKHGQNKL